MTIADKPWTQPVLEDENANFDTPLYPEEYASLSLDIGGEKKSICYLLMEETIGKGDKNLGADLAKKTFAAMVDKHMHPNYVVFMNSGALLAQEDSPIIEYLKELVNEGVSVLTSAESADFYEVRANIKVGVISSMAEILVVLHGVDKVVTL
ncbi:MAG: hypothetical protein RSA04_00175 [Clostridiales bacterium]